LKACRCKWVGRQRKDAKARELGGKCRRQMQGVRMKWKQRQDVREAREGGCGKRRQAAGYPSENA
jgi:hypothetical protein